MPLYNDEFQDFLIASGATSFNLSDAQRGAFASQSITASQLNGMWVEWLRGRGYTGTLNDMLHEHLIGEGYSGTLNDMLTTWYSSGSLGEEVITGPGASTGGSLGLLLTLTKD